MDEQEPAGPGWEVTDADGNVVESGPGITLQAVFDTEQDEQ